MLFLANFDLPHPCHTLSHISGPPKVHHTSRTPQFLVQKTRTKASCTNSLSIVRRGFVRGYQRAFCLEGFVRCGFCPFPLLSEYICYSRKLNITLNFMFHMYDKKCISVTSNPLYPPPTPSRTPAALERDVLCERPQRILSPVQLLYS